VIGGEDLAEGGAEGRTADLRDSAIAAQKPCRRATKSEDKIRAYCLDLFPETVEFRMVLISNPTLTVLRHSGDGGGLRRGCQGLDRIAGRTEVEDVGEIGVADVEAVLCKDLFKEIAGSPNEGTPGFLFLSSPGLAADE
jgi:hypothetical protein